jgi:hypothetical protein
MGAVKLYLGRRRLEDRELHNSRMFIDLCENIHIHYREYRFVFSIDEFFEFTDILVKSMNDIKNYLFQNHDYREGRYNDTLLIACGKDRQLKFLVNSPEPHRSKYYNNDLAIELQDENVTDEIHFHYRDLRMVWNRDNFKKICEVFIEAYRKLLDFEENNDYQRCKHVDREVGEFNISNVSKDCLGGIKKVAMENIKSYWYKDIKEEWQPEKDYIKYLKKENEKGNWLPPLLVTSNYDKCYYIVDGHHRYYAAKELGKRHIECLIIPMKFEETDKLRKCEILLKQFDEDTRYKYDMTGFLRNYLVFKLNKHYFNDYFKKVNKKARVGCLINRITKKIMQFFRVRLLIL